MNKNIIGLDKPASWRNVREKPGGCALFKRGIDIYFFILALKYVSFFFFFSRRFYLLRATYGHCASPLGFVSQSMALFQDDYVITLSRIFVHREFNVRFIFFFSVDSFSSKVTQI